MSTEATQRPWVFLTHVLDRVGPPLYLLHYLRWVAAHDPRPVHVVALAGGPLAPAFREVAQVTVVQPGMPPLEHLADAALVHVNTAISVRAVAHLPPVDATWVPHVHELEVGLALHTTDADWALLARPDARWIAASRAVAENLTRRHGVDAAAITVHHEMVDARRNPSSGARRALRARLGVPEGAALLGTLAVVNWRKGPDLFLQVGARVLGQPGLEQAHLAWIGPDDGGAAARFAADVRAAGLEGRIHVLPPVADSTDWLDAIDVFVLTSREDAFPLVCLEAAAAGRPIVAFDSGGIVELVEDDCGAVVPYPDVVAFAKAAVTFVREPHRARRAGIAGREKVRRRHDVTVAAPLLHRDLSRWSR